MGVTVVGAHIQLADLARLINDPERGARVDKADAFLAQHQIDHEYANAVIAEDAYRRLEGLRVDHSDDFMRELIASVVALPDYDAECRNAVTQHPFCPHEYASDVCTMIVDLSEPVTAPPRRALSSAGMTRRGRTSLFGSRHVHAIHNLMGNAAIPAETVNAAIVLSLLADESSHPTVLPFLMTAAVRSPVADTVVMTCVVAAIVNDAGRGMFDRWAVEQVCHPILMHPATTSEDRNRMASVMVDAVSAGGTSSNVTAAVQAMTDRPPEWADEVTVSKLVMLAACS